MVPKRRPLAPPSLALRSITSKTGKGIYASSDTLFRGAVFGRDSLEVAEDLMSIRPKLIRNIILTLAKLQGVVSNDVNEEERGKIIHEYRTLFVDGKPINDVSRFIFDQLAEKLGREGDALTYYGSTDATPLFVRVVGCYVQRHGRAILKERVLQRDGMWVSVQASVTSAIDWIIEKLDTSTTGLLEYKRRNPHGIENQVWKDSREFYVHENGERVNHHLPISSIELQALTYDALQLGAKLLPERADELRQKALKVRDTTIELLWQPQRNYFALGTDHAKDENIRVITTATANPAALLDSCFFDELEDEAKQLYISGIVRNIMGTDFLTDAGIRSRALSESHLIKFWDYHGSFTTWPKETFDIAKGMKRQGFPMLGKELENRLLNIIKKSQSYPEFVYVDARGRVLATAPSTHSHGHLMLVESTNKPESIQAWTLSAAMAIITDRNTINPKRNAHQQEWQHALEKEVRAHIPHVRRLKWSRELNARYPDYEYRLNITNDIPSNLPNFME